jgi:hypothetical protein
MSCNDLFFLFYNLLQTLSGAQIHSAKISFAMVAKLHVQPGIQPVQTSKSVPSLHGQHVCDKRIIGFLKSCNHLNGPYVHAKPVCWRDRKQKEASCHQWSNLQDSDTFGNFVYSISRSKNVHIGLFQTKDVQDLEQTATAKRICDEAKAEITSRQSLAVSPRRTRRMGGAKARALETVDIPTRASNRRTWNERIKHRAAELPSKQRRTGKKEEKVLEEAKNRFHVWGAAVVQDSVNGWHVFIFDTDAGPLKEKNCPWTGLYWKGPVEAELQEHFDNQRERDWLSGPQRELVKRLRRKLSVSTVWIGDVEESDKWRGECARHTTCWVSKLSTWSDDAFDQAATKDARFWKFRKFGRK